MRQRGAAVEHYPLNVSGAVAAAWGSGPADVWAVGAVPPPAATGLAVHFDGTAWTPTRLPVAVGLRGVWGAAPNDFWAVGGPFIFHWDGAAWSLNRTVTGMLTGIWGSAANDVWAVGNAGVMHFDGSSWSAPSAFDSISAIHGTARDDVWLAGATSLWHGDGTVWRAVPTSTAGFARVFALSPTDVVAESSIGLMQWDGGAWTRVSLGETTAATALWGSGPADVWAAYGQELFRCDGRSWQPVNAGAASDLLAVEAASPTQLWALGAGGQILRGDGRTWSTVHHVLGRADVTDLAHAGGQTWVVGKQGMIFSLFDGGASLPDSVTTADLFAVHAISTTRAWAVGGPPGTVLEWNGTHWSPLPQPVNGQLTAVWASPDAGEVWVGDTGGGVHRWSGASWAELPLPLVRTVKALWGSGGEVFATTRSAGSTLRGGLHRFSAGSWSTLQLTVEDFSGISGSSPTDVWFAGAGGGVRRWDGGRIETVPAPLPNDLRAISVAGGAAWAVGFRGTALRFDGVANVEVQHVAPFAVDEHLVSVSSHGADDVWVSTPNALYHRSSGAWTPLQPPPGLGLVSVIWANAADDVWASFGGQFAHWDGSRWTRVSRPVEATTVVGLWGRARCDVWAVAPEAIIHWDGTAWSVSHAAPDGALGALSGTAANDVWASGANGLIHFDGTRWSSRAAPVAGPYYTLYCPARDDCWTANQTNRGSQVFRWSGGQWAHLAVPGLRVVTTITGTGPTDVYVFDIDGAVHRWDGTRFHRSLLREAAQVRDVTATDAGVWAVRGSELLFHPR